MKYSRRDVYRRARDHCPRVCFSKYLTRHFPLPRHPPGGGLSKLAAFFAERAMGGAGLMVTGGISPNRAGTVYPMAAKLTTSREAR